MFRTTSLIFALFVLLPVVFAPIVLADGMGISITEGTLDTVGVITPFLVHRVPNFTYLQFARRDLELLWDAQYPFMDTQTLDTLASTIAFRVKNPLGIPVTDIRLVHDMLSPTGSTYNTDPTQPGFLLADPSYGPLDRQHVDFYVYVPGHGGETGGRTNSFFSAAKEDSITGHWQSDSVYTILHLNSLSVPGPLATGILDTTGTGWARTDGLANWGFDHEFQHALPKSTTGFLPVDNAIDEIFSSAAEAVGGEDSLSSIIYDAPYTWSLLGFTASADTLAPGCLGQHKPTCTCLQSVSKNYQGWRSFSAYLALNFRGTDTTASLAGIQDDRLYKWARTSPGARSLAVLRDLLTDANCAECAQKPYFKDYQGNALPAYDRLQVLHHNWRVANYVNNPNLASRQYGFPTHLGFSPPRDIGAWRDIDGCAADNPVAIPPEVTVGTSQVTRETTFVGTRYLGTYPYRMILQPFGSEYWVVRADGALTGSTQDLVVRVAPEGVHHTLNYLGAVPPCGILGSQQDGRLMASVVGYTYNAVPLWKSPQKAELAVAPRWVDVDSVAGNLELVVPNFGSTYKAAVVVITLGDGPSQFYSGQTALPYIEAVPYRITLALRKAPADTLTPTALVQTANQPDDSPTWSPTGSELAFSSKIGGATYSRIYRVSSSGGTPSPLTGSNSHNQYRPDWSPRGDWVAFEQDTTGLNQSDIWRYDVTTNTLEKASSQVGLASWPSFGPNGRFLAYVHRYGFTWELRRFSFNSGADIVLVGPVTAEIKSPRWTSDGKAIYFTKNDSLYAVSSSGGTVYGKLALLGGNLATEFDLHRGQGRLALEQPGAFPFHRTCIGNVLPDSTMPYHRVALCDTLAASDTQARFYQTGVSFYNPRWSPNGARVAYSADPNQGGDRDLFVGQVSYNHAPVFNTIGDQVVTACDAFTMGVSATDADGEAITYKVDYLPAGASFSNQQLQWNRPYPPGDYYVVFRALDSSGGVDSKVVLLSVVDMGNCGEGFAGGGGGGGGSLMANLGDDASASIGTDSPGANSLFAGAPSGQMVWDALRLSDAGSGLSYSAWLRTGAGRGAALDGMRLQVVDHSADTRPYLEGQNVVLGHRVAATQALTADDANVTGSLDGAAKETFVGSAGTYVTLTLPGEAKDPLVLEARRLSADISSAGGVQVQVPDGTGWRQVAQVAPRRNFDEAAIDCGSTTRVRLVFASDAELRFAGRVARSAETPTVSWATLDAAQDAKAGDVKSAVLTADGTTTAVMGPDTLNASFTLPSLATGQSRDCFLWVQGTLSATSATTGESSVLAGESLPTEFALFQNQPNPFSGTTAIRFALPRASVVRLEVFDVQGRRVALLANAYFPAGYHAVQWDHRGEGGAVSAGVYHYRMQAGTFHARKKMVLLP